jgi:hypothetical protein
MGDAKPFLDAPIYPLDAWHSVGAELELNSLFRHSEEKSPHGANRAGINELLEENSFRAD